MRHGPADIAPCTQVRVAICGGDDLTRAGLGALLAARDGIEVAADCAAASAVADVERTHPDVAVLAGFVPATDGERIGALTRVVAFAGAEPAEIADVIAIGARAVLPSGAGPEQLVQAIRVVAASDTVLLPLAVHRQVGSLVRSTEMCRIGAEATRLTTRETDVLQLLADGLSNAEVAGSLFVSAATVRTHVHHILRKLDVRSRAQAIAVAYRAGLVSIAEGGRTAAAV